MSARQGLTPPLVLFAAILTGCATTGTGGTDAAAGPAAIRRVCAAWPAVSWSSRDTVETIADVKASNAARDAFCAPAPGSDAASGG